MIDSGMSKPLKNLKLMLEIEIKHWMDRETPPTDEEWDEYRRRFNKYIEMKTKIKRRVKELNQTDE